MTQKEYKKKTLIEYLKSCNETVRLLKHELVEEIGRECRTYTKKEEWLLERIETVDLYVKKALFEIKRSEFKSEHEI